jgi:hypothetical protein
VTAISKPEIEAPRNGLVMLSEQRRLSNFACVAVNADLVQGKQPRFHDGMTLEDAVIITSLPREEAARRISEMRKQDDPKLYAINHLGEGIGKSYAEQEQKPKPAETPPAQLKGKVLQFPMPFIEQTRAVSNPLARCALFAPVKERQYFRDYVVVGEVDGIKIEYKGEQLNQDDHDAFLQIVAMANNKPLGDMVLQSVNNVLRGLGRENHKSQRQQLFAEIDRLVSGTLRFTAKGKPSIICHLISNASTPQDQAVLPEYTRHLSYSLDPLCSMFYNGAVYSLFNWQERVKLKGRGSELAKWLHLWIIGHAEQYAHKVETIRDKCGSRLKDLNEFRRKLRFALDLLKEAGIIATWRIDDADLVHIERTPSGAQLEHIAKKTRKPRTKPQPKE